MATLRQWLIHRSALLGLNWPEGVAEAAGISPDALRAVGEHQTLSGIARSARGYLARALKVSVRDLESLAAGRVGWIDDARQVDRDRTSPGVAIEIPCALAVGVPIVGRIISDGRVEQDDRPPQDQRRLPIRYKGAPDAFALELMQDLGDFRGGTLLIFQPAPPGELREGELALLSRAEMEVRKIDKVVGLSLRVGSNVVPLEDVLRAGRVIGVREFSALG